MATSLQRQDQAVFLRLGGQITGHVLVAGRTAHERNFRSFFGVSSRTCADAWARVRDQSPAKFTRSHFLWGLMLMKVYAAESVLAALAGTTRKTFRKWSKIAVQLIADLARGVVSFVNRCLCCFSPTTIAYRALLFPFRFNGITVSAEIRGRLAR